MPKEIRKIKAWAYLDNIQGGLHNFQFGYDGDRQYSIFTNKKSAKTWLGKAYADREFTIIPVLITPLNPKRKKNGSEKN